MPTPPPIHRAAAADSALLDATYRKIFWRLVPLLMFLWVIAWLDRINISFAKFGMNEALGFSEAAFGLGAGILYIGYVLFELPSNLALQKIGARKTIARIGIGWGLMTVLTAFVAEHWQFYAVRFLLGAFEAGFYPGAIFYLSLCFPSNRRAKVFGIFMSSAAVAGIIGGPLTSGIMSGFEGMAGFGGWQWVFILQGLPAILGGFLAMFFLTDNVRDARWLSIEQRAALAADLDADLAAQGAKGSSFGAALRDPRMWVFIAIYFLVMIGNSVAAYFGPTLLGLFTGAERGSIALMASGTAVLGAVGMIASGYIVDRTGNAARTCITITLGSALCFIAAPFFADTSGVLAAVVFGIASGLVYSILPSFWQLPNMVFTGTAAAAAVALINSMGNVGGFVGPTVAGMLRAREDGVQIILWSVGAALVLAVIVLVALTRRLRAPKQQMNGARHA